MLFTIKCESFDAAPRVRNVTVQASSSDEANRLFWESVLAPLPSMRANGYVPISIIKQN